MILLHPLVVLGLALSLSASPVAPKVARKHHHAVHGVVESVDEAKGVIHVRVHHHKPGTTAVVSADRKFHVNGQTAYEIVTGPKGKKVHKPATLADVHAGEHVVFATHALQPHMVVRLEIIGNK
jgi:hypothetical protein